MLPKNNRASTKEVEQVFKTGRIINSQILSFRFLLKSASLGRKISFVAPKNVSKLAVKRNLLRRRGYSALKETLSQFPVGIIGVFVFKKYEDNSSIILNEIKNILNKIN